MSGLSTAAEEALANLNQGGGVWTLQRLPSAEQTDVWNALNSIFKLSALELHALKEAKRESRVPVTVSLKYSNRKAVEVGNIFKDEISVGYLKSEAILCWKDLDSVEFDLHSSRNHVINDDYLQKCSYPLALNVKVDQQGFSEFADPTKALEYAGVQKLKMVAMDSTLFPQPLAIADDDPVFLHACEDLKLKHELYDPLEDGCEYTRREFISAILVLAATKAGVKLACEEVVEGSRAKGPVDWMAHYEEHGICITEGKKDNISAGLYQNLAQLTALGEKRGTKRRYQVDLPLFGVATTYREWIFTCLSPAGVNRDAARLKTMFAIDGDVATVKQVAQRLAGILDSQRQLDVDASGPPSKRPASTFPIPKTKGG